jgi:peptidoglycan/xylan/chitin deacetylase (PgdA/CDA1 family)
VRARFVALILVPASIVPFAAAAPHFMRDPAPPPPIPAWRQSKPAPGATPAAGGAVFTPPPTYTGGVPVLVYHGVTKLPTPTSITQERFAEHMAMLRDAGFHAIATEQFARWPGGSAANLPSRPILITFDHGRLDSYKWADGILREHGMRATMFVSTAAPERRERFFLQWPELEAMAASGRWDIQLNGGDARATVPYDAAGHRGPAYAYHRHEDDGFETFEEWRSRVHGDIERGIEHLREHIPGYRPLAFAVPYANYGQAGTNDPEIAKDLDQYLHRTFAAVFISGHPAHPPRGAQRTLRRLDAGSLSAEELYRWLATDPMTDATDDPPPAGRDARAARRSGGTPSRPAGSHTNLGAR